MPAQAAGSVYSAALPITSRCKAASLFEAVNAPTAWPASAIALLPPLNTAKRVLASRVITLRRFEALQSPIVKPQGPSKIYSEGLAAFADLLSGSRAVLLAAVLCIQYPVAVPMQAASQLVLFSAQSCSRVFGFFIVIDFLF